MTTRLTFPASMFSVVCQRCGSTVRKNADSCPNCGADRSAAFGAQRETANSQPQADLFEETASASTASTSANFTHSASHSTGASAGRGMNASDGAEPSLRPNGWDPRRASERIAQKAAEYRARRIEEAAQNDYDDPSYDPDSLPGTGRNRKKTLIAAACGLVLIAGAAFYFQQGSGNSAEEDDMTAAEHSAAGSIDPKLGALTRGATDASNAPVAPIAPAKPANPALAQQRSPADTRTIAPGDPLRGVRTALDQHDLTAAHTRLKALSAQQQSRPEYGALKDEIVRRETQRDAALQLARACERTSAWTCVQQNAGEALALDVGNAESQAMLERVIAHAGWLAPTASAALANKAQPSTATAANPATGSPAPAQANVAAVPPAAKPGSLAQKPGVDRRTAQQRNAAAAAAARQAAEDARAEAFARGQAATNALTASTMPPPVVSGITPIPAPTVATTQAPPAPRVVPQQQTQSVVKTNPPPAHAPYYLGQDAPPAAAAPAAPAQRAPYYVGDEAGQPAARQGNGHAPYYLGEDPPAPAAPAPRTSVPRPPQPSNQGGGAQVPAPATTQGAVPRPPSAMAQPVAETIVAPRVPSPIGQPAATGATPQFGNLPAGSRLDSDKSEALERAIKQYGWSDGETAPKPSR